MHFNLTILRIAGVRLTPPQLAMPARLVSVSSVVEKGYRCLIAKCCYGGSEVGKLWSPTISTVGDDGMVVQGFEAYEDAGVVQEWRLTPHCAGSHQGERHEANHTASAATGRTAILERPSR